ncbi:serine hydrolase domain-containing protein [Micromonospora sp. C28SCA-DRY-2]|uniref:serine hydrolase domain-containing protein n=1 Tax=Micromonospora sp. C28SCA-DRY-2 TaxID=3059522 RepID=UPI002674F6BE|nr:serine hydrolase domain-containing protein [Micromonospora sp. C28SCA-DRY-2]MDO3700928.1 serine hydrolase domain-containing protein [Micromonospora sp. C28SCA-DRY-2]
MRKPTALALVVGLVATLAGFGVRPPVPRLTARHTGDAELAATVRAAVADPAGLRGLAVAVLADGRVRTAGLGDREPGGAPVEPGTPFEIGSVTKGLTGMLLARRIAAGAVRADDPLSATLPRLGGPTAEVTLDELASHRSGLPRLALGPTDLPGMWWANLTAGNPYGRWDADRIVSAAAHETPGDGRGRVDYSNVGMALLGQALAAQAGASYPALLDREVLRPTGLDRTVVATDADGLPAGRATGTRAGGRAADPWLGSGYAPAGIGVWSTAEDLARLVGALLAGTAPGAEATTARFTEDDRNRVGYGWFTTRYGDHEVVWHNGGTGGFRAYVGFERATGRGVVVLGNTDRDVDPIGLRLLGIDGDAVDDEGIPLDGWVGAALALGFSFLGGVSLLRTVRRMPDRLSLAPTAAWALLYLGVGHRLGDWSVVPGWLWPFGVGLSAAGLVAAAYRWRELPTISGAPPRKRLASLAGSALVAVPLLVAVVA